MPLCTLKIPKANRITLSVEKREEANNLCNEVLDVVLHDLKIPDPEDREIKVVFSEENEAGISVSFTTGNVYPGFEPESFLPTKEQLETVTAKIQSLAGESSIKVDETTMEAWANTTFILRENAFVEVAPPEKLELLKEIGKSINSPKVKLVLSPKKQVGISAPTKEGEPPKEEDPYQEVAKEISAVIAESLGLPEELKVKFEVEHTLIADADVSVEFDCNSEKGLIPEKLREYIASKVGEYLDKNNLTKDGSAEVWIRQGEPEIVTKAAKK